MAEKIVLAGNSSDAFVPDELLAGEADLITNHFTMAESTVLAARSVVALNSSDELVQWAPGASDGTEVAIGVLIHAKTTGVGENPNVPVYVGGYFNTDALVWPGGATASQKLNAFIGTKIEHKALI